VIDPTSIGYSIAQVPRRRYRCGMTMANRLEQFRGTGTVFIAWLEGDLYYTGYWDSFPEGDPPMVLEQAPETPSVERGGHTTAAGTVWSIKAVRDYVPFSLPEPVAQPEGCSMGGSLIITFTDGATAVYGPCVRPASIERLWAAMEFVVTHGGCLEDCGPGGEPPPQLEGE
jgi:hypothetical protein